MTMAGDDGRRRGYRALAERAGDDPLALASLARLMHGDGLKAEAAALAERAWTLAAGHAGARSLARETLSADVQGWHRYMVGDGARNAAYEAALIRAITPDTRVFEIGTGSGLLAMMAARAGARHVYTCEAVPAIARAAREIVALNGFADRVTVLDGHSSAISAADLGGPADVLVSEIVSNDLLGEGVLPALSDAIGRLVVPGGAIIPAAASVRVALARFTNAASLRFGTIEGFDLSPFDRLTRAFHRVPVESRTLSLRSAPASLFAFDFARGGPWPAASACVELAPTGEDVDGFVQWIALEMDAAGRYENRPGSLPKSALAARFFPMDVPGTSSGGPWNVHGRHEAMSLRLWAEPAGAG